MFNFVYKMDLKLYRAGVFGHILGTAFMAGHRLTYGDVMPSMPDEVFEEAEDENAARYLDDIAEEMGKGAIMLPVINGEAHLLVVDVCAICQHTTLLNIDMECFRCGNAMRKA